MENSELQELLETYEAEARAAGRRFNLLGNTKLLLLLGLCGLLIWSYLRRHTAARDLLMLILGFAVVLLALLAVAWVAHSRVHQRLDTAQGLTEVVRRYQARAAGEWQALGPNGGEFADREHPYAADLDIVGERSLFQLLNVAGTWYGRQAFARDLLERRHEIPQLEKRHAAVRELGGMLPFLCRMQLMTGRAQSGREMEDMMGELSSDAAPVVRWSILKAVLLYMPAVTVILLLVSLLFRFSAFYLPVYLLLCLQALLWVAGMLRCRRYFGKAGEMPYKLRHISKALALLEGQQFQSAELCRLQKQLTGSSASAAQAFAALGKIADQIHARQNTLAGFVLNVLLLWDYECAFRLEEWKKRYSAHCRGWLEALGELESLMSLATLGVICPHTCQPRWSRQQGVLSAEAMGHPLILPETRVDNSFELQNRIVIISGSNMSGKTTFLRSVGINLVLAQAGGFVCAGSFEASLFDVMTSMRIADDLGGGISTFYAELRRIRALVDRAKQGGDLLFLVDEIFRGTNSVDRLYGAREVMARLDELGVAGLITTHDLELCQLAEKHTRVANYSFSEQYADGIIHFDYQIRPGRSTTTNARYLMQMVGVID